MSVILFLTDTESARASRKQYEDTLYSVLFDMNVPAVCAVDQVCILTSALILNQLYTYLSALDFFLSVIPPVLKHFCLRISFS
jgi:hypothetical protein